MATQISHDPFARQSLMRETVDRRPYCGGRGCRWCGNWRHRAGKPMVGLLFRYGTERDDRGGINWHTGEFCSKSCHDSYHG